MTIETIVSFKTVEELEADVIAAKAKLSEALVERIDYNVSLISRYDEDYAAGIMTDGELETYDMLTETVYSDRAKLSDIYV